MLIEGVDYNIENGLFVFTKDYHLKKGHCCKNMCKNCPWNYTGHKNKNTNGKKISQHSKSPRNQTN
jgi:hypothetical protein